MASPSYWCRGSWNCFGLCWWWLSQIVQEYYSGHRFVTWWSIENCAINDGLAGHRINDEPWTLAVSFAGYNLWWQVIGVFWCIWHVLARSWLKWKTIHNSSISKTGPAVIFQFLVEQPGLEWHPNHTDFLEAEMVYVAGDSPKLCSKIIQVVD